MYDRPIKQKGAMSNETYEISNGNWSLDFALSLAGCGNSKGEQAADSGTSVNSQSENQAGDTGASDDGGENSTNLDNLIETASLRGSVADFQDGSFQVVPDQDDGQIAKSAAEGMESGMESTTVSYGEDCTFQIANINSSTGAVELEAATASDVKNLRLFMFMEKHRMMGKSMLQKC